MNRKLLVTTLWIGLLGIGFMTAQIIFAAFNGGIFIVNYMTYNEIWFELPLTILLTFIFLWGFITFTKEDITR